MPNGQSLDEIDGRTGAEVSDEVSRPAARDSSIDVTASAASEVDAQGPYAVVVDNLSFTYAGSVEPALSNVNLRIRKGEVVLLVGLTAAGKSTLYLALSGLIPHVVKGVMTGTVTIGGLDTADTPLPSLSEHVGLVLQDPGMQLFSLSVEDELAFGPENLGVAPDEIRRRVDEAVKVVGLEGLLQMEPGKLSGGQQQSVAVGAIWAMLPDVLVLDEPTSNLDPVGSRRALRLVQELSQRWGKTVLIAEHKIDAITPFADRVLIMENGSIVEDGTPAEVFGDRNLQTSHGVQPPITCQVAHLLSALQLEWDGPLPLTVTRAAAILDALLPVNHSIARQANDSGEHHD